MIYAFCIAVSIAALAGMGIGGGGLLVIWLVLVCQMETQAAQGTNLLFFILSALAALPLHIKKRTIHWRLAIFLISCALPGTVLGAYLAGQLSTETARQCFGWFLLLSGTLSMLKLIKKRQSMRKIHKAGKNIS